MCPAAACASLPRHIHNPSPAQLLTCVLLCNLCAFLLQMLFESGMLESSETSMLSHLTSSYSSGPAPPALCHLSRNLCLPLAVVLLSVPSPPQTLFESGMLESSETSMLSHPVEAAERRLELLGPVWRAPSLMEVLRQLPFLRGQPQSVLEFFVRWACLSEAGIVGFVVMHFGSKARGAKFVTRAAGCRVAGT
jgi:hypothetical protein